MICPNCQSENTEHAKFCTECGTELEVREKDKFCIECGEQLPSDANFCNACGASVNGKQKKSSPQKTTQSATPKTKLATLVVLSVMIALIVILVQRYMNNAVPQQSDVTAEEQGNNPAAMAQVTQQLDELKARLEKDPNDLEALQQMSNMYLTVNKYEEASEFILRMVEIEPHDVNAWLWLGECYFRMENYEKALAPLEKAFELDNKNEYVLFNLGAAYLRLEREEDAIKAWQKLVDEHPDSEIAKQAKMHIDQMKEHDHSDEESAK